jgi:uroporphyrinogen decarboxylase
MEDKMNNRERLDAVLNYKPYDRMPVVHFSFWRQTLQNWSDEGHLKEDEIDGIMVEGSKEERAFCDQLGFDFNYNANFRNNTGSPSLFPVFEQKTLELLPDGRKKVLDKYGAILLQKEDLGSLPYEVGHTLTDRRSWEEHYVPRLQNDIKRLDMERLRELVETNETRTEPIGIYCKSLMGQIRNVIGVVNLSYMYADDEELYREIIQTYADVIFYETEETLKTGAKFDNAHFWEDICFKNGPLVSPSVFSEIVGPHYKRITDMVKSYGIKIISLDCDGVIDSLIPIWFENGINTMFPIEVGTWGASIEPWRKKYGKELRGVGGVNKLVFDLDYSAVDAEVERMKPLVDLGGFIPCPDHRIQPTAKYENVVHYCNNIRKAFG